MKPSTTPDQTRNIIAAALGALLGLAALAWSFQHEAIIASLIAVTLIALLGHFQPRGAKAMVLCGVLGLACARLTILLIQ